MTPKVSRGGSHKGLAGYLQGGSGGQAVVEIANDNAPVPQPQQPRPGFTKLYNFAPGEAKDITQAAKVMALTVRDADLIKKEAGIKPGGAKSKGDTAYHLMLSWHPSENPSEEEKVRAALSCLAAVGLGIDKGYQTYIREHRDTDHAHVHVHVNLVHPETGLQANPHRDQERVQAWGHYYDKARGNNFCPERTQKFESREKRAALDNARRPVQDFDRAARGAAIKPAVARLKADTAKRYADLKSTESAERDERRAESRQLVKDRRAGREAIAASYAVKLNAVWNPPKEPPRLSPDRNALAAAAIKQNERRDDFRQNELSMRGRLRNAASLAGDKAGMFAKLRLALDADRRRDLFDSQERAALKAVMPAPVHATPQPATPVPKSWRSNMLKQARQVELSAYDKQTHALTQAMQQRHGAAQMAAAVRRDTTTNEITAAWQQLRATYRLKPQVEKAFTRAAEPPKMQVAGQFQPEWTQPYKVAPTVQPLQRGAPVQAKPPPVAQPAKTVADRPAETRIAAQAPPVPAQRDGPDFKQVFKAAAQAPPRTQFNKAATEPRAADPPAKVQPPAQDDYRALLSQPATPRPAAPEPTVNRTAAPAPSGPPNQATPATSKPTPPVPEIEQAPQRKADQFGRSRDRAPRAPRDPERREQQKLAREAARAGKTAQEAARGGEGHETAAAPPSHAQQPPAAQEQAKTNDNPKPGERVWSDEKIAKFKEIKTARAQEKQRANDHPGREL